MVENLAPIKGRVLEYLSNKGIQKKKFFEKIEVSSSNFRGNSLKSEINAEVIAKISTLYSDVNPIWLLTGEGEMLSDKEPKELSDLTAPINGLQDYSAFEIMEHILLNTTKFQENETYKLFIENVKNQAIIDYMEKNFKK